MELKKAMHIARNPYGWNEFDVREARLAVCDEVERLEKQYLFAAELVASLYEAVTHNTGEPVHDVLEDVQVRIAKLEALEGPWCVHVQGPDDLLAMPSKDAADLEAAKINKRVGRDWEPGDPEINAIATIWPYSVEAHAVALAEVLAESV